MKYSVHSCPCSWLLPETVQPQFQDQSLPKHQTDTELQLRQWLRTTRGSPRANTRWESLHDSIPRIFTFLGVFRARILCYSLKIKACGIITAAPNLLCGLMLSNLAVTHELFCTCLLSVTVKSASMWPQKSAVKLLWRWLFLFWRQDVVGRSFLSPAKLTGSDIALSYW